MSSPVVTASEEEPLETVVERMLHTDVNRIPILRDGDLVGIVARHDRRSRARTEHELEQCGSWS